MKRNPLIPAVILVEPREEGNVGAAARAMANMGLAELTLVRPQTDLGATARAFAVGAGHILESARVTATLDEAIEPFHRVVGTTSARARELPTSPIGPAELPEALRSESPGAATALVFGPEVSGLDNEHLARCGLLVRVPCDPIQPTLNLAQAVLILGYELYKARLSGVDVVGRRPMPATAGDLEGLLGQLEPLLAEIGFQRDDTFHGVLRDLRRLAARAGVTEREVTILRGICRRAQRAIVRRP